MQIHRAASMVVNASVNALLGIMVLYVAQPGLNVNSQLVY